MHVHRGRNRGKRTDRWADWEDEVQETKGDVFRDSDSKTGKDLLTYFLIVTIIPIWLNDQTLHLISEHKTPPVIPDSWEEEKKKKTKVQFNRFTARENWVGCGCLTKSLLSQSLYISGFTQMSTDESVSRTLPVTPVSTTTWQIAVDYRRILQVTHQ